MIKIIHDFGQSMIRKCYHYFNRNLEIEIGEKIERDRENHLALRPSLRADDAKRRAECTHVYPRGGLLYELQSWDGISGKKRVARRQRHYAIRIIKSRLTWRERREKNRALMQVYALHYALHYALRYAAEEMSRDFGEIIDL